jgi:Kef-type K+ transport system membrane component KefB
MFYAGMELDPKELLGHVKPSISVAFGGFIVPFILGLFTAMAFGATVFQSLFIGMGLSVTAIAVQAVVLENMQILKTDLGHIIIGAAIIDDILSLITLSVLLGIAKSGVFEIIPLLGIVLKVTAFFGLSIIAGHFLLPRLLHKLGDYHAKGFTFAIVSALIMAYLAELAGLHLILGAFLAGQFVRKEIMDENIYKKTKDRFFALSFGFLTPVFFVSLSFHLHLEWETHFIVFALAITFVAFVGKLIGCGIGAAVCGHSRLQSTIIGFGMSGRGAVELVVAAVALQLSGQLLASNTISEPLLTPSQFSSLVFMAFITTLLSPICLKWAVAKTCSREENEAFCILWSKARME